jgi:hypothetical protein
LQEAARQFLCFPEATDTVADRFGTCADPSVTIQEKLTCTQMPEVMNMKNYRYTHGGGN